MGHMAPDFVSNGTRKIRARTPQGGGSLNKGNRYTVNTARTVVCAADMPLSWHGDAATMPHQGTLDKIANRVITAGYGKRNVLCPGCGLLRSAANRCDCNS
jgi:hypothetical protein